MFAFSYPATFRKDEAGRILVLFPDFPHSATDGANALEAMEEAIDCLGSAIAFAMVYKEEIPPPSAPKRGQRMVPVPLSQPAMESPLLGLILDSSVIIAAERKRQTVEELL